MCFFFFFKQKTAYEMRISDWSSDVCSSDLHAAAEFADETPRLGMARAGPDIIVADQHPAPGAALHGRPAQRRAQLVFRRLADGIDALGRLAALIERRVDIGYTAADERRQRGAHGTVGNAEHGRAAGRERVG